MFLTLCPGRLFERRERRCEPYFKVVEKQTLMNVFFSRQNPFGLEQLMHGMEA